MNAPPNAVIYCRISQDRTGAGLGVERQLEDARALAKRHGWNVVKELSDNDLSAYSGKTRPAYRALLEALDRGLATIVIAWHTDRLHRSPTELEEYIDLSERRGVSTHTVQAGPIDLSTPSGRMTARIHGAVARHESEHKAERIRRARLQKARAGQWGGGIRPFGFEDDGTTHHPTEAPAIARAVREVLAGASLRAVTRNLTAAGHTTTLGKPWSVSSARDMLLRPRNAGIAVYRGQEIGPGQWDPIVPEARFRAVVALLTDPARRTSPGNQPRWLGSLLYRCGAHPGCGCDGLMVCNRSGGSGLPSYRCRKGKVSRRADTLDGYVVDVLLARLSRADAQGLLAPAADGVNVAELQARVIMLRRRKDDLAAMFATGEMDAAQFAEANRALTPQLDTAVAELAATAQTDPLVPLVGARDVRAVWDGQDLARKRLVLDTLATVTVRPGRRGRTASGGYTDLSSVEFAWKR